MTDVNWSGTVASMMNPDHEEERLADELYRVNDDDTLDELGATVRETVRAAVEGLDTDKVIVLNLTVNFAAGGGATIYVGKDGENA